MQYPGRCVCELLDGVRFFYGVELSSSLCTICGCHVYSELARTYHPEWVGSSLLAQRQAQLICLRCYSGARDPSPPIGYVHANAIPTEMIDAIEGPDNLMNGV